MLGVTPKTVQRMVADGRLAADYGGRGGTQRFKVTDLRQMLLGPHGRGGPVMKDTVEHGLYAYTRYKCRCEVCRKARSDYVAKRHETQRQTLTRRDKRHGLRSTYTSLGCRCALCRRANTEYNATRRESARRAAAEVAFDRL